MTPEDLRREFWTYLHSRGFPSHIDDEVICDAVLRVEAQAYRGKRLRLKGWSYASGGLHSEDVALIMLLAEELGLKQGLDWDWGLEPDNYHFEVAYRNSDKVKKLLKLVDLYNEESLVFLNLEMRLSSKEGSIDPFEVQRLLAEEREKLREWKRIQEEETVKALERFFDGLEGSQR